MGCIETGQLGRHGQVPQKKQITQGITLHHGIGTIRAPTLTMTEKSKGDGMEDILIASQYS
jgi:hypothetical protein